MATNLSSNKVKPAQNGAAKTNVSTKTVGNSASNKTATKTASATKSNGDASKQATPVVKPVVAAKPKTAAPVKPKADVKPVVKTATKPKVAPAATKPVVHAKATAPTKTAAVTSPAKTKVVASTTPSKTKTVVATTPAKTQVVATTAKPVPAKAPAQAVKKPVVQKVAPKKPVAKSASAPKPVTKPAASATTKPGTPAKATTAAKKPVAKPASAPKSVGAKPTVNTDENQTDKVLGAPGIGKTNVMSNLSSAFRRNVGMGFRIAALRLARGMTQEEMAKRLSVTRSAIAQWESDLAQMTSEHLKVMAKMFNVSHEFLYNGAIGSLTKTEFTLVSYFRTCSAADKAMIMNLLNRVRHTGNYTGK